MQYAEKHNNAYPTFCKFSKMIQNRTKLRNHLNFSAGAATQKRHKIVIKRRDKEDFLNPEMSQKTIPHWMDAADGNTPESKTLFISQLRWPKTYRVDDGQGERAVGQGEKNLFPLLLTLPPMCRQPACAQSMKCNICGSRRHPGW